MTEAIMQSWAGTAVVVIFIGAYLLAIAEEFTLVRKSKPMILGAGLIWFVLAIFSVSGGEENAVLEAALEKSLTDFAALMLFLLVAMTYVNVLTERNLFAALRAWLIRRRFSLRKVFWLTGVIAFFISPIADNLTTALLMGAVVISVGHDQPRFVPIACINIVIAANAGGAFSPFGDITTLMVWQADKVPTADFLHLFIPAAVNFLVPALGLQFAFENRAPDSECEAVELKDGTFVICGLFLLTIVTALSFEHFLHLPPYLGMMTGLSYLMFYGVVIKRRDARIPNSNPFSVYRKVAQAEWDTLMFFFGVIFAVGGLDYAGYLGLISEATYGTLGPTQANVLVGIFSAFVDNIPIMFGVLTMNPDMDTSQWLLITLTAGVGGSLLSIGSAAGVALMGQSQGQYSFFKHLKWSWLILLGYAASIATLLLMS